MKNTDLHTHSYYSDGQISPKDLVRLAEKRGVKNLALTDHDSVKGVSEAIKEGKIIGVNVIPGVEIRCDAGEILGYFIDIKNKELIGELNKSNKRVQVMIKDWCNKLNRAGYKMSYKELEKKFPKARGNLNELHPLYALYLKKYGKLLRLSKKFKKDQNLKRKKIKEISVIKAIELVKKAGGVPVLAHPWIGMEKGLKRIGSLVKAGLKGIESSNGDDLSFMKYKSKDKNIVKTIKKAAKKYNLIITSGSDFHGPKLVKLMPGNHDLGKNNCDEKVVEELFQLSFRP